MELEEFVRRSVVAISNAVASAATDLRNEHIVVNPPVHNFSSENGKDAVYQHSVGTKSMSNGQHIPEYKYYGIEKIHFNLVITESESDKEGKGGKINVGWSAIGFGVGGGIKSEALVERSSQNTMSFSVPVSFLHEWQE